MADRDELMALRRMAELEAKSGGTQFETGTMLGPDILPNDGGGKRAPTGFAVADVPLETGLTLGTGMVAAPAAGLAGLGASAAKAAGLTERNPADVVRDVQETLTYQPRTRGGQTAVNLISWPFQQLAKGADVAGGAVTDVTGSPALGAAANTAIQSLPAFAFPAGSQALQAGGRRLMQSAMKPSKAMLKSKKAEAGIQTALDEGISVTEGGVTKLRGLIDDLNAEITQAIARSPATVDKHAVASRLQAELNKFEKQALAAKDVATIQNAWNEFLSNPLLVGRRDMPVQLAQELKQGTYRALGDKAYGMGLKPMAERDAQKALARGLKEEIAAAVPEVGPLNARESALINARNLVEDRVLSAGNRNLLGLGPIAPNTGSMLAFLADRSPWLTSLLARGAYQTGKAMPTAPAPTLATQVSATGPREDRQRPQR